MTPRFPWRGLAILAALAAALGLPAGWHVATLTETDIIDAAAARYVRDHGGAPAECVARPGTPPVWIEVLCGTPRLRAIYQADRFGFLTGLPPADPATAAGT